MRRFQTCLLIVAALSFVRAQTPAANPLDILFIDVEGGQATLMVTPSGESLLVDAGWAGFNGRDADRIAAVARQAGVKQISARRDGSFTVSNERNGFSKHYSGSAKQ